MVWHLLGTKTLPEPDPCAVTRKSYNTLRPRQNRQWHFQMHFLGWDCMNFDWYFTGLFLRVQLTISSTGSDNGLAPIRRQAIIWTNDGKFTDAHMRLAVTQSQWVELTRQNWVMYRCVSKHHHKPLVWVIGHHQMPKVFIKGLMSATATIIFYLCIYEYNLLHIHWYLIQTIGQGPTTNLKILLSSWTDCITITFMHISRISLGMRPANERCRYNITISLIGWAHI